MASVAFHFNAPQKVSYACRLLRKAYLQRAEVAVLADEPLLQELDRALWLMAPGEFLPHCLATDPPSVRKHSPIQLATSLSECHGDDVLLNLRDAWPDGFERFSRVVEVVTPADDDRQNARQRWRQYLAAGVEPQRFDLQARAGE